MENNKIAVYNLLVRNNVPQMIVEKGGKCTIKPLKGDINKEVMKKINDDIKHLDLTSKTDFSTFACDVISLFLLVNPEMVIEDVLDLYSNKIKKKGGYSSGIILETYEEV